MDDKAGINLSGPVKGLSSSPRGPGVINQDRINLSGPINYFLLSKNDKQVHIFFDVHSDLYEQTKCEEYSSVDIDKYIKKVLDDGSKTKTMDFFLEIFANDTDVYRKNENYMLEIRKFYRTYFHSNKKVKNIRMHYLDIRDYIYVQIRHEMIDMYYYFDNFTLNNLIKATICVGKCLKTLNFMNDVINHINKKAVHKYLEKYEKIKFDLTKFDETVKRFEASNDLDTKNESIEEILIRAGTYKIIKKILTVYNDEQVMSKIKNMFEDKIIKPLSHVIDTFNKLHKKLKGVEEVLIKYEKNPINKYTEYGDKNDGSYYSVINLYPYTYEERLTILHEMNLVTYNLSNILLGLYVYITDFYFIRRLLNNVSIKKSIVYTGAKHSSFYIWVLVKYFDYKIDEYYYVKEGLTKNDIYKTIKTMDDYELDKIVSPPNYKQCVEINKI